MAMPGAHSSLRVFIELSSGCDMADPLSITSGVVALITFGLQASKVLQTTINSLQNRTKTVRDLRNDVLALYAALEELNDVVGDGSSEFDRLRLPLYSCGTLCNDFNTLLVKCTQRTTDSRASLRDWTKLQFRGSDIDEFRTTLAGYKSTIQIAIGAMNLYVGMLRNLSGIDNSAGSPCG